MGELEAEKEEVPFVVGLPYTIQNSPNKLLLLQFHLELDKSKIPEPITRENFESILASDLDKNEYLTIFQKGLKYYIHRENIAHPFAEVEVYLVMDDDNNILLALFTKFQIA